MEAARARWRAGTSECTAGGAEVTALIEKRGEGKGNGAGDGLAVFEGRKEAGLGEKGVEVTLGRGGSALQSVDGAAAIGGDGQGDPEGIGGGGTGEGEEIPAREVLEENGPGGTPAGSGEVAGEQVVKGLVIGHKEALG